MDKAKKASAMIAERRGNCAQSVLTAFCSGLGLDETSAYNIAQAFGGGMHINSICGAVTGAYMVLSLANPVSDGENSGQSTEKLRDLQEQFNRRFRKLHGSLNCTELINHDLTVPGEAEKARESGIFVTKCPIFVSDAVNIIEGLIPPD